MCESKCRPVVFRGGPYDGARDEFIVTVDRDGYYHCVHLTPFAIHFYISSLAASAFDSEEDIVVYHDSTVIIPRLQEGKSQ